MTDRRVRQGDCISSLASDCGFHPDTIWNEPDNQELKAKREDSNVHHPNDVVTIPEKRTGEATGETGKRHSFRRKGRPERLRIICLDYEREPIRHTAYDLWIDGTHRNGTTDGEGLVDEAIPPDAKIGKMVVGENGDREEYKLLIGQLDPGRVEEDVAESVGQLLDEHPARRGRDREEPQPRNAKQADDDSLHHGFPPSQAEILAHARRPVETGS